MSFDHGQWGPYGWMVWGAGLSSCDLQAACSIPVATRSCDFPHHRGFGDCDALYAHGYDWNEFKCSGLWAEIGHDADPPKNANNYQVLVIDHGQFQTITCFYGIWSFSCMINDKLGISG